MSSPSPQSHGHPLTVAAVVGSFALAVGLVVRVSGLMNGIDVRLWEGFVRAGFPIENVMSTGGIQPWWGLILLLVVVYGMALLLLEVPGTSRRVMLAASALVLVVVASPVMGLWGVFWSPFVAVMSGAWSAFCATLWARHHPMPCEVTEELGEGKVISITKEQGKVKPRKSAKG